MRFHALAIALLIAAPAVAQQPIDVYLFLGQSNATGFLGTEASLPVPNPNTAVKYSYRVTAGATIVDSPAWTDLQTVWSTGGSEMSFGAAMASRSTNPVAIVKVSANGTSLFVEWSQTWPGSWYPQAVTKISDSLAQLVAADFAPSLAGAFWIQGEADAVAEFRAAAYEANLTEFVGALRTDLDAPSMPFYLNQLHAGDDLDALDTVRAAQQAVSENVDGVRMVNIDDLLLSADNLHLQAASQIEMGRRFADMVCPSADFDYDGDVDGDDLTIWQTALGTDRAGDADSDNVSDGSDFLIWQRQLSPPLATPVPEPSWLILAASAIIGVATCQQARNFWSTGTALGARAGSAIPSRRLSPAS